MTVRFRNIDADPLAHPETWGQEGVLAVVDRGALSDWHRLARAIEADPFGEVATQTEAACDLTDSAANAAVLRAVLARARRSPREVAADRMRQALRRSGLTQTQFAARLGTSRPRLSTYLSGKVSPSADLLVEMKRIAEAHHP